MGKSNLLHTALAVRKLAPEGEIIILADNDLNVPREAQDAARAVGGLVAVPELNGRKCDAWDVWTERGAEAMRACVERATSPGGGDDPQDTVARLAALSPIEYDRVRQTESDALGVRVTTLDAEVEKARRKLAGDGNDTQGDGDEARCLRTVEISIESKDPKQQPRPRPQADILIDIGLHVSKALFCGDDDRPYAVIRDRSEVWGVASKRFREWLRGCYFTLVNSTLSLRRWV